MAYNIIREARIEDVPFIVDMIRSAANEGVFHPIVLSVEEFKNFAFGNPPEGYLLLVYQIGDEIAGYADSRARRGVGHILGIYVKPRYRRKGVGKKLINETLDSFRKRGCHKARLEVFADNHNAIKFYARLNFVQEGFLRQDEGRKDIIIMSKFLNRQRSITSGDASICHAKPKHGRSVSR